MSIFTKSGVPAGQDDCRGGVHSIIVQSKNLTTFHIPRLLAVAILLPELWRLQVRVLGIFSMLSVDHPLYYPYPRNYLPVNVKGFTRLLYITPRLACNSRLTRCTATCAVL